MHVAPSRLLPPKLTLNASLQTQAHRVYRSQESNLRISAAEHDRITKTVLCTTRQYVYDGI
jgi:hypothetical protein